MNKAKIITWDGKETGEIDLPEKIFNIKSKSAIIYPAVIRANKIYKANYGHAKGRGQVSGGGIKPWKQKGTGRARASSSRSQLWVGGGIAFAGGLKRSYTSRLNSKELKLAICMMLSDLARAKKVIILEEMPKTLKTNETGKALAKIKTAKKTLILSDQSNFSFRNLTGVKLVGSKSLGITDLIYADELFIEKPALILLEERL